MFFSKYFKLSIYFGGIGCCSPPLRFVSPGISDIIILIAAISNNNCSAPISEICLQS